jgi:hypothetical protein
LGGGTSCSSHASLYPSPPQSHSHTVSLSPLTRGQDGVPQCNHTQLPFAMWTQTHKSVCDHNQLSGSTLILGVVACLVSGKGKALGTWEYKKFRGFCSSCPKSLTVSLLLRCFLSMGAVPKLGSAGGASPVTACCLDCRSPS